MRSEKIMMNFSHLMRGTKTNSSTPTVTSTATATTTCEIILSWNHFSKSKTRIKACEIALCSPSSHQPPHPHLAPALIKHPLSDDGRHLDDVRAWDHLPCLTWDHVSLARHVTSAACAATAMSTINHSEPSAYRRMQFEMTDSCCSSVVSPWQRIFSWVPELRSMEVMC